MFQLLNETIDKIKLEIADTSRQGKFHLICTPEQYEVLYKAGCFGKPFLDNQ